MCPKRCTGLGPSHCTNMGTCWNIKTNVMATSTVSMTATNRRLSCALGVGGSSGGWHEATRDPCQGNRRSSANTVFSLLCILRAHYRLGARCRYFIMRRGCNACMDNVTPWFFVKQPNHPFLLVCDHKSTHSHYVDKPGCCCPSLDSPVSFLDYTSLIADTLKNPW